MNNNNQEQNFWIAYADLMAGLLFIFILIVGAIITKYSIIQSDVKALRANLEEQRRDLNMSRVQLLDKKAKLKIIEDELSSIRDKNTLMNSKMVELKEIKEMYQNSKEEIAEARVQIEKDKSILNLKDSELLAIEKVLLAKSKAEQKLIMDLNITKSKIKSLTGIRIKVIRELKKSMGKMIKIDPKSGAIRFSAKILFDQGKYELKGKSKQKLKKVLSKYVKTLFKNREIKQHIEQIIIEGHTNSDGGYFENLTLSQKRAGEVMKFLFTLQVANQKDLKTYFVASGRSDTDLIYDKKGIEDKSASRRIEIKFRIKNEDAIKEIENFLEKK